MSDYTITDYNDKPVIVGTRVRVYDFEEGHPEFPAARAKYEGAVIEITEFDGDVDDDTGKTIVVYPGIVVRFDTGDTEAFTTGEWVIDHITNEAISGKVEELTVLG